MKNLNKHPILKVMPTVIKLLVHLIAFDRFEINSYIICISEIPFH